MTEDAGYQFECVKVSLRQDAKGIFITLSINPADADPNMLADWVGTRYQAVMVRIADDETVHKVKTKSVGEKSVALAGELCRRSAFQAWMVDRGQAFEKSESACTVALRSYLGISTRSELRENEEARDKLRALYENYVAEVGGP